MTDFLAEKRQEIGNRLAELKPLVDEYNQLQEASKALANTSGSTASSTSATSAPARRPGRPPGSKTRKSTNARLGRPLKTATATTTTTTTRRRAGRRKGSGARSAQALAHIQGQPGITIPELATKMDIKQNYLYRVLPALEKEKKIKKEGRGWHPVM